MKLVETRNGWLLEDILEDRDFNKTEIRFKNMAGRQTNPKYNPSHVVVIWIDDIDIANFMRDELHLNVQEREVEVKDEDGNVVGVNVRHSLQLKAYPKLRQNRMTGKDESVPRVMLKTTSTGKSVRLDIDKFGLFDATRLLSADIKFHTWEYDKGKAIACIDELWAIVDEKDGEVDGSYLMNKYGYVEDGEELPWGPEE